MESGQDNEVWSFGCLSDGREVYPILRAQLALREQLRPYIKRQMQAASEKGSPVMRPLFYDFPEDSKSWEIEDEYMFGSDYLVCPVTSAGQVERKVYLPPLANGQKWVELKCHESSNSNISWQADGSEYKGGQTVCVPAPLEHIPVFVRIN